MELTNNLAETISKTINESYNLGVTHSIEVVADMILRMKEVPPTHKSLGDVNILDAAIILINNLKK